MTIYIVDIEAVDTRYTKQWKEHLPKQLMKSTNKNVVTISGGETPQATTPGAFLNFGGTNVYKSKQLEQIGEMFCAGKIKNGDYFLYTDAWNPTVIQLRYMAELLGVDIRIGGLWHAGSYDQHDFLGRIIGQKPWVRHAEQSMFACFNDNFFATQFHIDMFTRVFKNYTDNSTIKKVGWPMEYLESDLLSYKNMEKKNIILFPHRIAPEKQLDIFQDLKQELPKYEFIVCQEKQLTKNEYHNLLGEAKLVFSANLQETLGISWYEGVLVDTLPLVPDRLSYTEMAVEEFKYPNNLTRNFETYKINKQQLVDKIVDMMENYKDYKRLLQKQKFRLSSTFFSGEALYKELRNG